MLETRNSVSGRPYRLGGRRDVEYVKGFSAAFVTSDRGTAPIRASSSETIDMIVSQTLEATFDEEYSILDGTVWIGHRDVRQEEGGPTFRQAIGVWSNGRVACFSQANIESGRWLLNFLTDCRPMEKNDSAVLAGPGLRFTGNPDRFYMTLGGLGLLELDLAERRPAPVGKSTRVGTLFQTKTPNGANGLYVQNESLSAHLHLLQTTTDDAAAFVEQLTVLDREAS